MTITRNMGDVLTYHLINLIIQFVIILWSSQVAHFKQTISNGEYDILFNAIFVHANIAFGSE